MSDALRRASEFVEAGLIAPERAAEIAAVADGDEIAIDVDARRLDVALSEVEIAERVAAYTLPATLNGHVDVAIQKYARLVGSAADGALTN